MHFLWGFAYTADTGQVAKRHILQSIADESVYSHNFHCTYELSRPTSSFILKSSKQIEFFLNSDHLASAYTDSISTGLG